MTCNKCKWPNTEMVLWDNKVDREKCFVCLIEIENGGAQWKGEIGLQTLHKSEWIKINEM